MENKPSPSWGLVLGGTALSQVLNDNGHSAFGEIFPSKSILIHHTNKHYFKDVVLDENIIAYSTTYQRH